MGPGVWHRLEESWAAQWFITAALDTDADSPGAVPTPTTYQQFGRVPESDKVTLASPFIFAEALLPVPLQSNCERLLCSTTAQQPQSGRWRVQSEQWSDINHSLVDRSFLRWRLVSCYLHTLCFMVSVSGGICWVEQTFVTEGWWVMNCVLGGRCMKTSLKKQATPVQLFVCITKDTVCPRFTTPFDPYKFIKKVVPSIQWGRRLCLH